MAERTMAVIVNADDGGIVFVASRGQLVSMPQYFDPPTLAANVGFDLTDANHGAGPFVRPLAATYLGEDAVVRAIYADGSILFTSRELVQEPDSNSWIFRDAVTNVSVRHWAPLFRPATSGPVRLRAELRPMDIDRYLTGVAGLRELFQTSVRTGRPVHWV
jgi:hypothetical protein